MTRSHLFRIAALLSVVLLASCAYDEYSIELTPQGDVMQRELTVKRVGGEEDADVAAETLAAIAELYPPEVPTDVEGGHAFVGEFAYAMPDDVGGAGEYITFATRMGRCSAYIERFRGDDAPAQRIQAAFDAADDLTDILIGWLEGELGEQKDFPKLRAFMDVQFRNDLKDISIYAFLMDSSSSTQWTEDDSASQLMSELVARVAQFLMERKYILPTDAPTLMRAFADGSSGGDEMAAIEPFITNMLQRKMDVQDESTLAAIREMLADPEAMGVSLLAYVAETGLYQQYAANGPESPDGPAEPDPETLLSDTVARIFQVDLAITADVAKVALREVTEPLVTNGLWNAEESTVFWANDLKEDSLPAVCYAAWVTPDAEFQKQHFGRAILEGKDLLEYCLWRKSLTDEEAAEWDAMVDQLQPDDEDSLAMLQAFRFSREPAIDPQAPEDANGPPDTYASTAIDMLVRNLSADEANDAPADTPTE